jgi:hypothetical protein
MTLHSLKVERVQDPCSRNLWSGNRVVDPRISNTAFGRITVGGEVYEHDVVIRLPVAASASKNCSGK